MHLKEAFIKLNQLNLEYIEFKSQKKLKAGKNGRFNHFLKKSGSDKVSKMTPKSQSNSAVKQKEQKTPVKEEFTIIGDFDVKQKMSLNIQKRKRSERLSNLKIKTDIVPDSSIRETFFKNKSAEKCKEKEELIVLEPIVSNIIADKRMEDIEEEVEETIMEDNDKFPGRNVKKNHAVLIDTLSSVIERARDLMYSLKNHQGIYIYILQILYFYLYFK